MFGLGLGELLLLLVIVMVVFNRRLPDLGEGLGKSIKKFRRDLKAMQGLVANPKTDLFARIPWGDGQTVLREALLLADHNAYHVAQLVDVRRLLGVWPEK